MPFLMYGGTTRSEDCECHKSLRVSEAGGRPLSVSITLRDTCVSVSLKVDYLSPPSPDRGLAGAHLGVHRGSAPEGCTHG